MTNWHLDILPRASKRALEYLAIQKWLKSAPWYLAGGTALALQMGHRRSVDLDFFSARSDFSTAKLLSHFPGNVWKTNIVREGTVYGVLYDAKVSFIAYPFFKHREQPSWYGTVQIISPRDIAVMKIIAISQRGRKRDFVDLYWYVKNCESLFNVILRVPAQYPTVTHDFHHIIKSLMYFVDAEEDPMPELYFKTTWNSIKKYFQQQVPIVAKQILGLK